jgi:peptidoglycan/xylan/chitin deacetylase (PgdA/CDA1 family)
VEIKVSKVSCVAYGNLYLFSNTKTDSQLFSPPTLDSSSIILANSGWFSGYMGLEDCMNLVSFSLKTKGVHNFIRRLHTVFTRFGFSERVSRKALFALLQTLRPYGSFPTFFIPAVVLERHPNLLGELALDGAEIGIHGCVHNDYRTLSAEQQYTQTQQAINIFAKTQIAYTGFRNPYLGWTEASLEVFRQLGFGYESNEAVFHDVIDLNTFSPLIQSGFAKSLTLFQAIPCTSYTLRPHFEETLLRIPTSIPDDEMLFDRLRVTQPERVGHIWSDIMARVYKQEGIYTLNLHPERGLLCKHALEKLLEFASHQPLPVWITRLHEVAAWWQERLAFRFTFTSLAPGRWQINATCTKRAGILGRSLEIESAKTVSWFGNEQKIDEREFIAQATQCPCLALSPRTPDEVECFLREQGYALISGVEKDKQGDYACYLDFPEGLGQNRDEHINLRSALLQKIEALDAPLLRFGYWPSGHRAALAISGDIDSVTIQDFFLRIIEVR